MMSTLDRLRGRVDGELRAATVRAFAVADRERALDGVMARSRVIEHQARMHGLAVFNRARKSPMLAAMITRAMVDDVQRRRVAQFERLVRAEVARQVTALAEVYQRQKPAVDFSDLFQKSNH